MGKNKIYIEPVNNVARGYLYWKRILTEKVFSMFVWEGLPDSLPQFELENFIINNGFAVVFNNKKYGIISTEGGLTGNTMSVYKRPTLYTYSNPVVGSGVVKLGENAVVIYNSTIDRVQNNRKGFSETINRYARILADIDSSLLIAIQNQRSTFIPYAVTQQAAESLERTIKAIQAGETYVPSTNTIMEVLNTLPVNNAVSIRDLLDSRKNALALFLEEIGVRATTTKRERQIDAEVRSDGQVLVVNQANLLEERKIGSEMLNKVFGLNTKVSINPDYNPMSMYDEYGEEREVITNDTEQIYED